MANTYGVPEESTLADWPFGYDDLAPYYDRVEWELGVSGDTRAPWRDAPLVACPTRCPRSPETASGRRSLRQPTASDGRVRRFRSPSTRSLTTAARRASDVVSASVIRARSMRRMEPTTPSSLEP